MERDFDLFQKISSGCVMHNARRTTRAVTELYDSILAPSGVRSTQFTLLVAIRQFAPVPISRLAAGLGMDRTTLTRSLKPLHDTGWVELVASEDQRVRAVILTQEGENAVARALPYWEIAQERVRQRLGTESVDRLLHILHQIQ